MMFLKTNLQLFAKKKDLAKKKEKIIKFAKEIIPNCNKSRKSERSNKRQKEKQRQREREKESEDFLKPT